MIITHASCELALRHADKHFQFEADILVKKPCNSQLWTLTTYNPNSFNKSIPFILTEATNFQL